MTTKPISTSIYSFRDLISGGFRYVDKTEYIFRLVSEPKGLYFLSRPRRFGKSLFLSTLKEYFLGNRDIFYGLTIYDRSVNWTKFPIIHLDLGAKEINTVDDLKEFLINRIDKVAQEHNQTLSRPSYEERFHELIEKLASEGKKVVILIDEYDKPILGNAQNPRVGEILRTLKGFYAVIKATEPYQRFVFLTGVSKFSKVSVFSDLNNLTDITMNNSFSTAFGYTKKELEDNFSREIRRLSQREGLDIQSTLKKIKKWYNGYQFHYCADRVYNPVSVMNCFKADEFSNYWFETGTPTFLLELMKNREYDLAEAFKEPLTELAFSTYDIERLSITPLLFQTGYLTIRDSFMEEGIRLYHLDFPNREIEQAFGAYLIDSYGYLDKELVGGRLLQMSRFMRTGDLQSFFLSLHSFFAGVPNTITLQHEKYYQTLMYVTLRLMGLYIEVEVSTNTGRIDAVLKTPTLIYILEFKLHDTAEEALKQIIEKRYKDPFLTDGRKIICIGVMFDQKTRNIGDWITD